MAILSTLKYYFKNFIPLALFALPGAVFFALKYNYTHFFSYMFNSGSMGNQTLIKIFEHFSLFPSLNILMILLWSALMIISFCLLYSYIERHMQYGIKSMIKAFKSVNYSVMSVLPVFATVIALEELFSLANALFVRLLGLTNLTFLLPIIFVVFLLIQFFVFSIISMWVPSRMVTGYSNRDSIRYSIRLTQGKQHKIMLGLMFPLLVTAPIMILLKQISPIGIVNTIVYALCYIFIIGYIPSYTMAAYFDFTGAERKDIKNKLFRKFRY
jgi:hypothetical protein